MKSPTRYLAANIEALLAELRGVRDGDADAIHDARVATRRIREALPIASAAVQNVDFKPLETTATEAGRALGRARDIDVALELVMELERRAPQVTRSASALRGDLLLEQATARRRLVKKIDTLPIEEVRALGRRLSPRTWWAGRMSGLTSAVKAEMLHAVRGQAGSLRAAIVHGSGVYLPNRSHATRTELKKLRYVLEIAEPTRTAAGCGIELLKKAQSLLGKLHDVEVLGERLDQAQQTGDRRSNPDRSLAALLHAECATLHSQYLRRRGALLALCEDLERAKAPGWRAPIGVGGAVAGAGAFAATAWLIGERRGRETPRANTTHWRAS